MKRHWINLLLWIDRKRGRRVYTSTQFDTLDRYVTGTGQVLVNVHERHADCDLHGCVIHNPSADAEAIGPTHWRQDRQMMERICEHGVGHPDPDGQRWAERTFGPDEWRGVHGCDGCCA